ncbi:MAG: CinA family protein [Lentisphaerae bacterium]|nr:CinA family protein [Lentisphaerota bacterium]
MTPEIQLVQRLAERGLTLALAESCTGGMVARLVTAVAGASAVFTGGIVCYANAVKRDVLGVPQTVLDTQGAVSRDTAVLLADHVRALLRADLAAAVTGIAGPEGGSGDKPVGLVYIAVAGPANRIVRRYVFSGTRECIRRQASASTLSMLLELLPF